MNKVTTKELSASICQSESTTKALKMSGLIKPISKSGKSDIYNLDSVKKALGIPPDMMNERIITAKDADAIIHKEFAPDNISGLNLPNTKSYNRNATILSRKGYLPSYYFGNRISTQGISVLFIEKQVYEFCTKYKVGGLLYGDIGIDLIEDVIAMMASHAANPQAAKHWLMHRRVLNKNGIRRNASKFVGKVFDDTILNKIKDTLGSIKNCNSILQELESQKSKREQLETEVSNLNSIIENKNPVPSDVLSFAIRNLNISYRNKTVCTSKDIVTLSDLVKYGAAKYRVTMNVGEKAFNEMDALVKSYNLKW